MKPLNKYAATYLSLSALAVLAVLKLTGKLAWSWWWITAPVWASFLLTLLLFGGGLLIVKLLTRK